MFVCADDREAPRGCLCHTPAFARLNAQLAQKFYRHSSGAATGGAALFGADVPAGAFWAAAGWVATTDEQRAMAAPNPRYKRCHRVALVFMGDLPDQLGPRYRRIQGGPSANGASAQGERATGAARGV